jgi:hypothetical protein
MLAVKNIVEVLENDMAFQGLSQNCERRLFNSCLSVSPSTWNNSAFTGRIFMKLDIRVFFENMSTKFKFFFLNLRRITVILYEDLCALVVISRWILLRMTNFEEETEKIKHILRSVFFRKSFPLWDHVEKYDSAGQHTGGNVTRRKKMRFVWRMTKERKHTRTHTIIILILFDFHGNNGTRTRLNVTLYVQCLSYSCSGDVYETLRWCK